MARKSVSRSGRSGAEGFSYFDGATRADVGLATRHGDRVVRESCDHLPLFDQGRRRTASGSGGVAVATPRPAGREADPLSLGHITSKPEPEPKPRKVNDKAFLYAGGSLAGLPGIPCQDPRIQNPGKRKKTPRGEILMFTPSARKRCERALYTVLNDALAYTMALTLPKDFEALPPAVVKRRFLKLLDWLMASRLPVIRKVGGFWKQEFQKRGALHFHLLLYGIAPEDARTVQRWIAEHWCRLIGDAYPEDEREKHLWWHLRDGWEKRRGERLPDYDSNEDNFQQVNDFAGYFAKYYGKDDSAGLLPEPVPGKWWGRFNRANIPFAERKEIELPVRVRIHAQRVGRKIRQNRMSAAKHAAIMAKLKKAYHLPYVSAFQLQCGKHHRPGTPIGELYRRLARDLGEPFGKCGNSPSLRYSSVTLTGKHAPSTVGRILTFAGNRATADRTHQPF